MRSKVGRCLWESWCRGVEEKVLGNMLSGLARCLPNNVGAVRWRQESCQQGKSRVNLITGVLSGYLSTTANHRTDTLSPALNRDWTVIWSLQSYTLRKCSVSIENLVQRSLGQGGKMFLSDLSEDVVESQPRSPGQRLLKPQCNITGQYSCMIKLHNDFKEVNVLFCRVSK